MSKTPPATLLLPFPRPEFFTVAPRFASYTRASVKCIRNVKCTRRSPSKCKCLLSTVVIYASVENQYSGWAWADPPLRYHCVCAIVDTTRELQRGAATLERDRGTRSPLLAKSLFYDRFGGSMVTSKTAPASRFSGWSGIDLNWYQSLSASTWILAFYVARKSR